MRTSAGLGQSLGSLLSSALNGNAELQGQYAGMRQNQLASQIEAQNANMNKANAEADLKRQEMSYGTDESIIGSLAAGLQNGINGDNAKKDLTSYLNGGYQPREQQGPEMAAGSRMPTPAYASSFPELQQKFSALKQMMALGDKNIGNLSKSIQGDQRNNITRNLATATPQESAVIGQRTAALEGNVNPLEMQKMALTYGLTNGNNTPEAQAALLLSQGKAPFDSTGNVGTMNVLTGKQNLNAVGTSSAAENNAQAGLAGTRSTQIKEGKGDGSFKVDSSYQSALGTPAVDAKGSPITDPFSGRQIINRNPGEEENFMKWATENKYPTTDSALGQYIAKGRPRAGQQSATPVAKKSNPAYQEYLDAHKKYSNDPAKQKALTEFYRKKGIVK